MPAALKFKTETNFASERPARISVPLLTPFLTSLNFCWKIAEPQQTINPKFHEDSRTIAIVRFIMRLLMVSTEYVWDICLHKVYSFARHDIHTTSWICKPRDLREKYFENYHLLLGWETPKHVHKALPVKG